MLENGRTDESRKSNDVGERYYRYLLETSLEGVWVIDADGHTTFANSRMAEILRCPVSEMMGRSFLDFVPEELRASALTNLDRRRQGVGEAHEFRFCRPDGSDVWTTLAANPLFDERGGFVGALAMVTDITTSKRAEERLAEAQSLLRAVIEGTTDTVFVKDREGRYVFINAAGARVVGRPPEEIVGQDDSSIFGADVAHELRENDADVMRAGATATYEEDVTTSDGAQYIYSATKAPWRDVAGRVIGIVGISRDVTQRKQNEDEQRLLADVSDVLATSIEFDITLERVANLVVPRLADWCLVDLLDEGTWQFAVAHQERGPREVMRAMLASYLVPGGGGKPNPRGGVFKSGKPETGEVTDELMTSIVEKSEDLERLREMRFRYYAIVPLLLRGQVVGVLTLISAKAGRRYGAQELAVAAEIGRRAAMAIENARLYREAQRAVVARNDLLATVSHDLRNPLNVLLLHSHVLLKHGQGADRAHVEAIERAAKGMAALVADLVDAASLEAGHVRLECSLCDPKMLVDEVLEQFAPIAEQKELRLEVVVEPGLRCVVCDRARLRRVLVNLIDNALKFTPNEGRVTVRAETQGRYVLFAVTDTGRGIPDDQLQRIFDRYSQPGGAARGGAGLGLYIAKGIVEGHGGTIAAESREGSGTTLQFTIPAAG